MKQNLALRALAVAIIFLGFVEAGAAPADPQEKATSRQKIESVSYLVGTWNCDHTVGTFAGKYSTTYSKVLGGLWLKQTYDFPPQQTKEGTTEPAINAETLMGFDERRQAWVRFFANSEGLYFPIRMTDTGNGWSWKYVSFFPRTKPETSEPDATFTKKTDKEYTIDGPSYEQNGTRVTEHHTCHKS
jgi:hypothetical protein